MAVKTNNLIWGIVLAIAGFAIAVVGLRFTYPTSLFIGIIGLVTSIFGYLVFRGGVGAPRSRRGIRE
jgi:hypothetical protein